VPRSRLGVALLVPPPLDRDIDALRLACGDGALARLAPHVTLVPPINVRADALDEALAVVRAAAGQARPLTVSVGPPTTFDPESPTLFLAVAPPAQGDPEALDRLVQLRTGVFQGPLHRERSLPFVPHVTLADGMDPARRDAAIAALADYRVAVTFDRVHVLEERHLDEGRRWVPVADCPLAPPAVVGRGGLPLELTTSTLLDPQAARFEEAELGEPGIAPTATRVDPEPPVVVVARRRGQVVGVARGRAGADGAELASILVAATERGQGIGRHLHVAFRHAAETASGHLA
jgi:2'-5' RNA ligase